MWLMVVIKGLYDGCTGEPLFTINKSSNLKIQSYSDGKEEG